jgi:predicted nuclease with RNAse H fold
MQTAGIDLAAQPAQTGLCIVEWAGKARCVGLDVGVTDDDIVAAAASSERCGIDAPFGYPQAFVDFVAGHAALDPTAAPGADTAPYRLRETDAWVWRTTGRRPLSVSTDLIGITALRCARLQLMVAGATGDPVDRTGAGRLVEVYPAAALAVWGVQPTGYKRRTPESKRLLAALAARVVERFDVSLTRGQRSVVASVDHAFDALVAAIVAREVVLGRTTFPPPAVREAAKHEGWIHVPGP